ncbi:hypothetical protein QE152_g22644 [Popillia japonica]|uniref:Uncharacterized protein n=1 Tax=Popillia japonica TaxID=7064 RepID=A0AAW1KKG8_POPJA
MEKAKDVELQMDYNDNNKQFYSNIGAFLLESLYDSVWLPEDEEEEFEKCLNKVWRKSKIEQQDIVHSLKKTAVTKESTKLSSEENFEHELPAIQMVLPSSTSLPELINCINVPSESVLTGKNGYHGMQDLYIQQVKLLHVTSCNGSIL